MPQKRYTTIVFDQPAEFPLYNYSPQGSRFRKPGVLIVEGMTFVFDEMGNYRVEGQIEITDRPVMLRLQFHAEVPKQFISFHNEFTSYSINPEPKRFEPDEKRFYQKFKMKGKASFLVKESLPVLEKIHVKHQELTQKRTVLRQYKAECSKWFSGDNDFVDPAIWILEMENLRRRQTEKSNELRLLEESSNQLAKEIDEYQKLLSRRVWNYVKGPFLLIGFRPEPFIDYRIRGLRE
ncbi:MAG: hypothetical protein AAGA30_20935, partial [Planctomycetota bacterium]